MQIGIVFFFQEKWDDALVFYERALQIAQKKKEERGISIAYNNMANIYQKKEILKKPTPIITKLWIYNEPMVIV